MSDSYGKHAAVASFTEAASRIYADGRLTAQEKVARIVSQYEASVARLQESGELTRVVARELEAVVTRALHQIEGLSRELGESLAELIHAYQPSEFPGPGAAEYLHHAPLTTSERVVNWWDKTFLPWWRDDSC